MHKYLMLYGNDNDNQIESEYIDLRYALKVLKKYKVYIFKYNQNEDILYINYPLNLYYNSSSINIIDSDKNNEENIQSFGHIEVRLLPQYAISKLCVNMQDL